MASDQHRKKHHQCVLCGDSNVHELSEYYIHQMLKCDACGMVFMARIPSTEELNEHYTQYAYGSEQWISPITLKRYHQLLDQMDKYRSEDGGRLLDVGCGMGHFLCVARERGWDVWGSEYSKAAVQHCESKGIRMYHGAHHEDAFPIEYFDVITSFEVLEHLQNPMHDTSILCKWLRKGGLFYATTPNWNAWHRRKYKAAYDIISYPEHLMYFTRKTITHLAVHAGLRVVKTETTGINFTRIARSKERMHTPKTDFDNSATERMRSKTETHWFWSKVKKMVNTALTLTGTGSTLKIWSEKE